MKEDDGRNVQKKTRNRANDTHDVWDYCLNIKATLDMHNGIRFARLTKAPFECNKIAKYQVRKSLHDY